MASNYLNLMYVWLAALCILPQSLAGQASPIIAMDQEPHHHLVMENDVVKLFQIDLPSRDAIVIHRHDHDEVSIAIGEAATVSTTPGQADILSISKVGDVSFAHSGSVHSLRNIGQTPYRAISISLLHPQTRAHNLCGRVLLDQPLQCPAESASPSSDKYSESPLFESDQTQIRFVRVSAHQTVLIPDMGRRLVIPLGAGSIPPASRRDSELTLHPGDYVWFDKAGQGRKFENESDKEEQFIELIFPLQSTAKSALPGI
jgi:quercetin dioxygenase-like cupin family protein